MPTLEQARGWYPATDPVHGFDHILRVLRMAEYLGGMLGADPRILRAAALLHDAQGSHPEQNQRAEHHELSARFARGILQEEGWSEEEIQRVLHCIRAHRYRPGGEAPATLEAQVLFDADKLDVLDAVGAARTIGYSAQAGHPIWFPPSQRFLAGQGEEEGELHSSYHEYLFKLRHVAGRLFTAPGRELAARRALFLEAFFRELDEENRFGVCGEGG